MYNKIFYSTNDSEKNEQNLDILMVKTQSLPKKIN